MYYPVQIPFILNQRFAEVIRYTEEVSQSLGDFVICFWEMTPLTKREIEIDNVIVTDGCIDLVVEYDSKRIGYAGMSKTEFHYKIDSAARCMGARLKPGAFHQLTGLPAGAAMDTFLPLDAVDEAFDFDAFFALPFERAKARFKEYLSKLTRDKAPDKFTLLFDALSQSPPITTRDLYTRLHFSSRQCQRLFAKRFGLTPQTALCLIRFQKCLKILTGGKASPSDILNITAYYDQSHFIKDFKRNVGLTPFELIRRYKR
ncbi:MAG: helix-turn-helix domain-containing protein [Clostridiales bacterium]|jgi:AraC-like DNA-binding protein|nr:helix-turn-helix domain-containing protein [Clostridiales bacterium]